MVPEKKILILPDAGPKNPFQYQMINLLEQNGYKVTKASGQRFFATFSAFTIHKPDAVYYDWIQSFILGKTLLITLLKCVCFFLEIQFLVTIRKKPVFHTLHNIHNHAKRWLWIERQMYRYFLKKCFRIRVYSQTTKDKIIQTFGLPPHKIYIIEDVPFHLYYPNTVTKEESRKLLELSSEQFVYLFLGMIKPYKGIEDLITAFQAVKSGNDFLIIAGSSDSPAYVATLRSLIARQPAQILFVNEFVPETAVQLYFNAANVVALPFKNIEHSGSIDLAMSFAKPVITLYTDFTSALLPHQQELLFKNTAELKEKLIAAKHIDGQTVGQTNFSIANRSNYQELVSFFKTDYTQTSSRKR